MTLYVCTLCSGSGFPVVATYITYRADHMLHGSCILDIYIGDVVSCIFAQDYALSVKQ